MTKFSKLAAVLMSAVMIMSCFAFAAQAADVGIDMSDLFPSDEDTGDTGDTGDKGDTGDTGDTGDAGDTGNAGDTGDKGDTGSSGSGSSGSGSSGSGSSGSGSSGSGSSGSGSSGSGSSGSGSSGSGSSGSGSSGSGSSGSGSSGSGSSGSGSSGSGSSGSGSSGSSNKGNSSASTEDKSDTTDNKTEEKVYNSTFSDVAEADWFYSYVTPLAAKGIIEGYPDGTFLPQSNITRAEFLKLLVTCMGYEQTEKDIFADVESTDWYYGVVATAAENGIISAEEYGDNFKPDEKITRIEAAKLLVKASGAEVGKYASPYKDTEDANITALYSIALMQGVKDDETGDRYFYPDTNITRAETSAVFTRLLEYNAGKDEYVEKKLEEYGIELEPLPVTESSDEINKTVEGAGENPASLLFFRKNGSARDMYALEDEIRQAFVDAAQKRPELFSLMLAYGYSSYDGEGQVVSSLEFKSASESYTLYDLFAMRKKAFESASEIAQGLYTQEADEFETACMIHDYIVEHVSYVEGAADDVAYTAYGALENGKATCQGYSAAFNLIARCSGIDSLAVSTDEHMWNVVFIDGEYYFFDSTWDDADLSDENDTGSENGIYKTFRGVSEAVIRDTHGDFDMPS